MRRYSAKETYNFIDPTDRRHPIRIVHIHKSAYTQTNIQMMYIDVCRFAYTNAHTDVKSHMYLHTRRAKRMCDFTFTHMCKYICEFTFTYIQIYL